MGPHYSGCVWDLPIAEKLQRHRKNFNQALCTERIRGRKATWGKAGAPYRKYFSVLFDTPTGATIVCTFGAVLIVMFFVHLLFFHGRNAHTLEGATAAASPRERMLQEKG